MKLILSGPGLAPVEPTTDPKPKVPDFFPPDLDPFTNPSAPTLPDLPPSSEPEKSPIQTPDWALPGAEPTPKA